MAGDYKDKLSHHILNDVIIIKNGYLGQGSYGKVFAVKYRDTRYAAKEIHSDLLSDVPSEDKKKIIKDYLRECYHSSSIHHPNIVEFIGIYYTKKSDLPIMVMELMDTSLNKFIEKNQSKISTKTKLSILYDASLGLGFLHSQQPNPIVHRDISSNNVLLTTQRVAKISDLGTAKMIRADCRQTKLTSLPGCAHFMPPEVDEEEPIYNMPVDVFSFAAVALHLFSEEWPAPGAEKMRDPETKKIIPVSEPQRRQQYLDKMTGKDAILKEMVVQCLDDDPDQRLSIQEVSEKIKKSLDDETEEDNEDPVVPTETIKQPVETPTLIGTLQSGHYHIKWEFLSNLPAPLFNASTAVSGSTVYVLGQSPDKDSNHLVFCYDAVANQWNTLPPTEHRHGIIKIVDQKLTVFGGSNPKTQKTHNKVSTYSESTRKWYKCYPDMIHDRHMPGVIAYNDYVIVMGGNTSEGTIHDSIEIMNYRQQLQWKEASVRLPVPMWNIKPTISGEYITIVGYNADRHTHNGFHQILVEHAISSLDQTLSPGATSLQWKELLAATYCNTAIVPYSNPLVTIGGDIKGVSSSEVTLYDESMHMWRKVDSLTSARSNAGVALLNSNTIIVIGGTSGGSTVRGAKSFSLTKVEKGNILPNQ